MSVSRLASTATFSQVDVKIPNNKTRVCKRRELGNDVVGDADGLGSFLDRQIAMRSGIRPWSDLEWC